MRKASDIVLKLLGLLLLTAAILKGWQLLTEPMANKDIWTNRVFLIFMVEFELTLGIWLLSGIFKKMAWLTAIVCFSLFSLITLYKGLTGAVSCGCFGSVQVNPWVTLFVVDLPAVIALIVFHPSLLLSGGRGKAIRKIVWNLFAPSPSAPRLGITACIVLLILGVTTPLLAFNKPAKITSLYEVLEPETWVGRELPISEYIDIGDKLKKGNWPVLFYHYNCPDCHKVINKFKSFIQKSDRNQDFPQLCLIEIPPYGNFVMDEILSFTLGKLNQTKNWFMTTPVLLTLNNAKVKQVWEGKKIPCGEIFQEMERLGLSMIVNGQDNFFDVYK